jgi:hypothetical protein
MPTHQNQRAKLQVATEQTAINARTETLLKMLN